jgi:hypothetical protein
MLQPEAFVTRVFAKSTGTVARRSSHAVNLFGELKLDPARERPAEEMRIYYLDLTIEL